MGNTWFFCQKWYILAIISWKPFWSQIPIRCSLAMQKQIKWCIVGPCTIASKPNSFTHYSWWSVCKVHSCASTVKAKIKGQYQFCHIQSVPFHISISQLTTPSSEYLQFPLSFDFQSILMQTVSVIIYTLVLDKLELGQRFQLHESFQ